MDNAEAQFSLDYNLDRLTIDDRKGLEIILLSSIFAILQGDKLDEHTKDRTASPAIGAPGPPRPGVQRQPSDEVEAVRGFGSQHSNDTDTLDTDFGERDRHLEPPVRDSLYDALHWPPQCTYRKRSAEYQLTRHYQDPNLVFLALLANSADTVPRAISIASEVKRHVMKHRNEDLMQFIDYPGRKDSAGQSARTGSRPSADKGPPRQMKIYLSRIPLEEFVPKGPAANTGPLTEKDRIAMHYKAQQPPPPAPRPTANGHAQPVAQSPSAPAVLYKVSGADPRRPPLPPKGHTSKEDEGKKRSFWSRLTD